MRRGLTITLLALLNFAAAAAENAGGTNDKQNAWDVEAPPGESRDITIDVRSGRG